MRTIIQLVCDACGRFNYGTTKNKTALRISSKRRNSAVLAVGHKVHKEKR